MKIFRAFTKKRCSLLELNAIETVNWEGPLEGVQKHQQGQGKGQDKELAIFFISHKDINYVSRINVCLTI